MSKSQLNVEFSIETPSSEKYGERMYSVFNMYSLSFRKTKWFDIDIERFRNDSFLKSFVKISFIAQRQI